MTTVCQETVNVYVNCSVLCYRQLDDRNGIWLPPAVTKETQHNPGVMSGRIVRLNKN